MVGKKEGSRKDPKGPGRGLSGLVLWCSKLMGLRMSGGGVFDSILIISLCPKILNI